MENKTRHFYYPCESSTNNAQNKRIESTDTSARTSENSPTSPLTIESEPMISFADTSFNSTLQESIQDHDSVKTEKSETEDAYTDDLRTEVSTEYRAPRLSTIQERLEVEALQEEMEAMRRDHAEQEDLHVRTIEELEAKLAASEKLVQQLKQETDDERATWKEELNSIKAQVSSLLDKKSDDDIWKERIEIGMEELGRQLLELQKPREGSEIENARGVGSPGVISEAVMSEVDSNDSGEFDEEYLDDMRQLDEEDDMSEVDFHDFGVLDNREDNSNNNDWKFIPDDWWIENGFSKCAPCQRWYKRLDLHKCHGRPTTRKINEDNKLADSLKAVAAWSWEP